jgi:pyruvate dehydrogenase E1 component alpha subunit
VELATYRWREHCGPLFDNDLGYRTEAEYLAWKARDPIPRLMQELREEGALDPAWLAAAEAEIQAEIEAAFAFAEASPFPDPVLASTDIYSREIAPFP